MGGELLVDRLQDILEGKLAATSQEDSAATYAGKIRRQDAAIDWSLSAEEINRKIRAYNPVPGAWFDFDGENIKCWKAAILSDMEGYAGVVLQAGKEGVDIACGSGALRILEVQRPGRRRVTAAEFASQSNLAGKRLG